jgi:putative colanic acid biosynthesis acetyltransferase WcaF
MEKISKIRINLSRYNNGGYFPGSVLKQVLWFLAGRMFLNTYFPFPMMFKRIVLVLFGARLGKNVTIKPKVNIKYPWFLTVGDDTWIGEQVWIDNLASVTVGSNCCLSQGCYILTGNHDFTKSSFDLITRPVVIEEGAWIGARAVVCPGVTAGTNAVLSVNSVATKNMEPYGIYQGNPAVFVKSRNIKS